MMSISLCIGALALLNMGATTADVDDARLWWERGAGKWYYKDDWKGLALVGGTAYTKTIRISSGPVSGWIVVWGKNGYKLSVNDHEVGSSVDGGLIDDYDLSEFLGANVRGITIKIGGREVCAEGEVIGSDGEVYPFATGDDWRTEEGNKPEMKEMLVGPSTGAYHRAHNGRLMSYNEEEKSKSAIAKCLARIQKLNDQSIFLMRKRSSLLPQMCRGGWLKNSPRHFWIKRVPLLPNRLSRRKKREISPMLSQRRMRQRS
ncbi:hypothetical protein ACFL6S_17910 [Candidatus Poribacteria bacterium]